MILRWIGERGAKEGNGSWRNMASRGCVKMENSATCVNPDETVMGNRWNKGENGRLQGPWVAKEEWKQLCKRRELFATRAHCIRIFSMMQRIMKSNKSTMDNEIQQIKATFTWLYSEFLTSVYFLVLKVRLGLLQLFFFFIPLTFPTTTPTDP